MQVVGGGLVSLRKLSREYFLLWVINISLYENTNNSTLPVCANKATRDKHYIKNIVTIRNVTKSQLTRD